MRIMATTPILTGEITINEFLGCAWIREAQGIEFPQCVFCKHWHNDSTCDAFIDQIPDDILFNRFKHTEPYKGDHGITYAPKDTKRDDELSDEE